MAETSSEELIAEILRQVKINWPEADLGILDKAYRFSLEAHQKQKRAGGAPFITHPLSVSLTLAQEQMDIPTIAAGILHDVLEDTDVTRETLLKEFGEEITLIVEGVTKIDTLELQARSSHEHDLERSSPEVVRQAENWRKMLLATAHDARIILLKLADRRHNMETLEALPEEKRRRIAEETITLYAPLAQRLGMYRTKSVLEDYAFKYLHPEIYREIEAKTRELTSKVEAFMQQTLKDLTDILSKQEIPLRISTRNKNLHSIYRKMLRQNKPFEEIQDVAGVRIITDSVEHCYALLGVIHSRFTPVPDTFTDYIALPKNNLYQSLHTTIRLPQNNVLEIQIRTEEMHRIAEYGIAAHWRYKLGGKSSAQNPLADSVDEKLDWIKQVMEWQTETKNSKEFLESLKIELQFDQVFVFTPKGEVMKLPAGSTAVDFAFAVHSELGFTCIGAKVDGKMVRLDAPLASGQCCEIITRKGQRPHKDWLEFVKTPRARSRIRKFLRENPNI